MIRKGHTNVSIYLPPGKFVEDITISNGVKLKGKAALHGK
jgi:hypothetical protein